MDANVIKVLKENLWYLGTYSNEPNAVPVAFKDVTDDGVLLVGDVFLDQTLKNIEANGKICVSVCNAETMEGYQIKGSAEYLSEGEIVDTFKKAVEEMFEGAATAKGALKITADKIIVTTPGPDNKKVL